VPQIKAADIGFFHPNFPSREPIKHLIYDKLDLIIRDVNFFTDRIHNVIQDSQARADVVQQILPTYLRGSAAL
jgi:hypothetical protein